jgi:very-short-patch-repair endonuclease
MDPDPGSVSPDEALAHLAASSHGVFLTSDALSVGITPQALGRRRAKGVIRRLHKGVYAMTCVPPSSKQVLLAACRWGGAGSAASHRSAAALWELDGFTLDKAELWSPRYLKSERVKARVNTVRLADLTEIEGIPVTRIERTLVDLAGIVDADELEDALDSALRKRLTTVRKLRLRIRAESRRKGIGTLRSLVDERDDRGRPSASRFETRLNRLLLRSGLPAIREFTVWDGGEFIARVDFCWPEARLIVEADGFRWHGGRRAWQRDRERRNRLTTMGWSVIQVTWDDLTRRPDALIDTIRSLLQPRLPI